MNLLKNVRRQKVLRINLTLLEENFEKCYLLKMIEDLYKINFNEDNNEGMEIVYTIIILND